NPRSDSDYVHLDFTWPNFPVLLYNTARRLHGVEFRKDLKRQNLPPTPDCDDRLVTTKARHVHTHFDWFTFGHFLPPGHGRLYPCQRNERVLAFGRKF